ncbi:MAG: cobalt transporter CbiM [Desulfurivibrio sp.]
MHIADGILSLPVIAGGAAGSGAVAWYCLGRIKRQSDPHAGIPKAALLTAAFFVASLIQIPLPPTSVHLVLNGLLGVLLGLYAFPAILVGLFFQAVMFGHGGLSTLGINGLILGLPALLAGQIFRWSRPRRPGPAPSPAQAGLWGGLAGAGAIAASLLLFVLALLAGLPGDYIDQAGRGALAALLLAHLPLLLLEGVGTGLLVMFLQRVKPQILDGI